MDLTKTVFLEVGPPGSHTLYYQYSHLEKKYKMCMHNSSKKGFPPQFNDASTSTLSPARIIRIQRAHNNLEYEWQPKKIM